MGIKTYKPRTPSLRFTTTLTFEEITEQTSEKALTKGLSFKAGRGAGGRISVRRRGGRSKRKYREIDFKRNKVGVPGVAAAIEYDPNRSANIALIKYVDGDKRYILAPKGLKVGASLMNGPGAPIEVGNNLPLGEHPPGVSSS